MEVKNFFDIANNINSSTELLDKSQIESVGNLFMLNRAMSNNFDTVFYAEEANGFKNVGLYEQYLFYFFSIPKKKRYGKWEKKAERHQHLKLIMDTYLVSEKKALEYLDVLTEDQLNTLIERSSTGGQVSIKKTTKKK